jgi:uncharacterized repeat protein (TIGR04138 family)
MFSRLEQAIRVIARETRYPYEAFEFVRRGLDFTVNKLHGKLREPPFIALTDEQMEQVYEQQMADRHVSGQELCLGLRDYAVQQYGLLARTVLRRWNVNRSEDFGHIVFAMVEHGVLAATDDDRIEDFRNVFDFGAAFSAELSIEQTT